MKKEHFKLIVLIFISLFIFNCSNQSGMNDYNTVVKFSKGEQLKFPDFTIEYTGERTETNQFPNGNSVTMKFHEFAVTSASSNKKVSWSSGTGDIAPAAFEIDGKNFELEMSNSEKLKTKLSENEFVIVKK
ncbi:MAG TPA: hypothetical protein PK605_04575 [Ignavibacteria bacterium]|nr:hypothetical protein [Bacteroidota bacterium]HRE09861.1 hypothetical protein [Ignavibacteria bacterium]HRF66448.1 hypothetical protein [Ignavibacteria bacterium]HRJ03662.1 hypothetical protein [Ignavibacteria bacterium]